MTKGQFINGFKIVIEPAIDRVEIPLSSFQPFVDGVREVADDYDIHTDEVEEFLQRHRDEFEDIIGFRISLQPNNGGWHD